MDYIQQIYAYKEFVNANKLKGFSLFDNRLDSSKIEKLFLIIDSDLSDLEIAQELGYNSLKDKNFIRLQKRLLKKLKSTLFFLDEGKRIFSSLGLEYYKILKSSLQHRALIMLGKRNLSLFTLEKDTGLAVKYEFPDLALSMSLELLSYYGYINIDEKKYAYYSDVVAEQKEMFEWQTYISKTYIKISKTFTYKEKQWDELESILSDFLYKTKNVPVSKYTHRGYVMMFEMLSLYYFYKERFDDIIDLASNSLAFFDQKPYDTFLYRYIINFDLVKALIRKKDYFEARSVLDNLIDQHPKIDFNYFRLQTLSFDLHIAKQDYNHAHITLSHTLSHSKSNFYNRAHEEWVLKHAYMHFLTELGYVDEEIIKKHEVPDFRLYKFLNQVPTFSKRKRNLNISILIIQMLIYLQQEKYNEYIDRMDALQQYSYRYLRNDDTLRSNCFIKMLLKIPSAHFHPVAVQRHVEKFHKKLLETPPMITDQTTNVEIIPYERLWEMVLELLEKLRK